MSVTVTQDSNWKLGCGFSCAFVAAAQSICRPRLSERKGRGDESRRGFPPFMRNVYSSVIVHLLHDDYVNVFLHLNLISDGRRSFIRPGDWARD
jgi:hypothetical protein